MLIFPIKKAWFDKIDCGEKLEEYRDETPYYESRLGPLVGTLQDILLRNGYSSASPTLQISALIRRGIGNPKWGATEGKQCFILEIKDKKRIKPETFIIKARYCKRCGGLLTSKKAIKDGYGHVCKIKTFANDNSEPDIEQLSMFIPNDITP